MASSTYSTEALVLRKTNLGESDLIVRMMDAEGRLLEAVAKGARKPNGSLSGRVELFNKVKVHCAQGKNLDILKEARLLRAGKMLHSDPAYGSAASCVAEFAARTIQPELEVRRYFELADAAFAALDGADAEHLPVIVAAYAFKASSMIGMRPSFGHCVLCGAPVAPDSQSRISYIDGGNVCEECMAQVDSVAIDSNLLLWADALLSSTFEQISTMEIDASLSLDLLSMAGQWALTQADVRLKSMNSLAEYLSMLYR